MKNIWGELRNDFTENDLVHIDAWLTSGDDEEGKVIALVNIDTGDVEYKDERARTDVNAQEIIRETLN